MSKVLVNVKTKADMKKVRKEKRNGRDVIIVPSATLPDNIVMNGIMYPADEIRKSFKKLERTPAPLGHPMINGKFVSARDPEGINLGWIGAWNENVRRENGRVFLDKIIDVEVANQSEGGKAVLAAIEAGGPVHTSTGLYCMMEAANGDVDYKSIAREIEFDHDAILLNEAGAATPEKGVGMLVNSEGTQDEIEVINSSLTEDADREIDWAGTRLVEALKRKDAISTWEKTKAALLEALGFSERATTTNTQENDMTVSKEQFDALSGKVDTLSEALKPEALANSLSKAIGDAVGTAMKPLIDAQATIVANAKAAEDKELGELRERIVKANLMDEAAAKELTLNSARALAKTVETKPAVGLSGKFTPAANAQGNGFKLPAAEGAK